MQLLPSIALLLAPRLAFSIASPEPAPLAEAFPLPEPFIGFAQTPITAESSLKVPGNNPLSYCSAPNKNILDIDQVDISPNPPQAGKTLTITATGTISKDIQEGAKVLVQVKYGLIRLISQEIDLCSEITKVDMSCPIEKGHITLSKDVQLPREIPPGKYSVFADALTKNDERITCLQAFVTFDIPRF
ncbi:Phosphatidylglycerol/phosphatidylinositol transfer protein [Ascosphaera pollenicola]|nr:Phosphatidylglycerol/phosphatidylinositol transfer protein [Ascosphaera pollenicola]